MWKDVLPKFKTQKNEDYYIEFYRLKLISPCNNQHKYYLHIQAGVLLLKEFILNFHRYSNPEGFYYASDAQYLSKKNCWRPVMTWAQSQIRMTAYQILLVAAGFFWFCFRFVLFSFVCWVLFPVHINDHVKDQSMPICGRTRKNFQVCFFVSRKWMRKRLTSKLKQKLW